MSTLETFIRECQKEIQPFNNCDDVPNCSGIYIIKHNSGKVFVNSTDNLHIGIKSRLNKIEQQIGVYQNTFKEEYELGFIAFDDINETYPVLLNLLNTVPDVIRV